MDKNELISKLVNLEKKIGYNFKNKDILLKSMLHSSFVNENMHLKLKCNERLEFLGDAVLELVISEYLFFYLKSKDEGVLSLKRSALVREFSLAKIAKKLRLQNYIFLGHGEKKDKGGNRDSVLSDALEDFLGAIYLDGGFELVKGIILNIFEPLIKSIHHIEKHYNYKNQLQELTQGKYKLLPQYRLINQTGPEHNKKFKVSIYLDNKYLSCGSGTSIKKAEQIASKNVLNLIKSKRLKLNRICMLPVSG